MTKGYGVRAKEIEGQNALALMLYFVYMMEGRNSQDRITSQIGPNARDQVTFYSFLRLVFTSDRVGVLSGVIRELMTQ